MGVGGWGFDIVDFFEEMEGNSCVWAEDDVAIAVGIFVLCLDDSGATTRGLLATDHVITPWSESPSKISASEEDKRSGSEMTPRHEFNDLRRRIPYVFQRTNLVGLALDSATSSGLGRAPRSAMQDPIQAPPGTTRQAGLYTS
ncbi:hypothetical protein TNCV_1727291 [Trichonephila clavipes]|nr:hypothetical protein TNCV_1727291 [Trichonephila clavipes]